MKPFNIIVAVDLDLGIGKKGQLPWRLSGDLKHFKEITCRVSSPEKKNAVIMGRRTWDSLPEKFRPLPERINVVVTRNLNIVLPKEVLRAESFEAAFEFLANSKAAANVDGIFVIGGGQVFKEALSRRDCQRIYLTQVRSKFHCDVFFPEFKSSFVEANRSTMFKENDTEYYFVEYARKQ